MNYLTRIFLVMPIFIFSTGCTTRYAYTAIDQANKPFHEVSMEVPHHYESPDGSKAYLENADYSPGKIVLYKVACSFGTVPFDIISLPVYIGAEAYRHHGSRSSSNSSDSANIWGNLLIGLLRLIPMK